MLLSIIGNFEESGFTIELQSRVNSMLTSLHFFSEKNVHTKSPSLLFKDLLYLQKCREIEHGSQHRRPQVQKSCTLEN